MSSAAARRAASTAVASCKLCSGQLKSPQPRTSQLQYDATVGRGFDTSTPEPGELVFFSCTSSDPGQDRTHVVVVSRIESNGIVWMIDAQELARRAIRRMRGSGGYVKNP